MIDKFDKNYEVPDRMLAAAEIEDPHELDPLCDFS